MTEYYYGSFIYRYVQKLKHYAIRYDGHNFYLTNDGPKKATISELITAYKDMKIKLPTNRTTLNSQTVYGTRNHTSLTSLPGSDVDSNQGLHDNNKQVPQRPKRPSSFLYLTNPVLKKETKDSD